MARPPGRHANPPSDLADFVAAHYDRLTAALTLHCGREDVAEDLAHEALVRACERWEQVRGFERPDGWLFKTAFNLSASRFRRRQAEARALARHGVDTHEHANPEVGDAFQVRAAVAQLPSRQRSVIILRYFLSFTPAEVAQVLDLSNGAVRSATHRALLKLREEIGVATPDDRLLNGVADAQ